MTNIDGGKVYYTTKNKNKKPFCTQVICFSGINSLTSNTKNFNIKLSLNIGRMVKVALYS